jgi:hypothetical protein
MRRSALAVLSIASIAADAIRRWDDIIKDTAENDHRSGEIISTTITGEMHCLKLTRMEEKGNEISARLLEGPRHSPRSFQWGNCGARYGSAFLQAGYCIRWVG